MSQRASARFCFWEAISYSVMLAAVVVLGVWFCFMGESAPNPIPWPVMAVLWAFIPGASIGFFTWLSWGAYMLTKEEEAR